MKDDCVMNLVLVIIKPTNYTKTTISTKYSYYVQVQRLREST